jgi:hypothetical protein
LAPVPISRPYKVTKSSWVPENILIRNYYASEFYVEKSFVFANNIEMKRKEYGTSSYFDSDIS